MTFRLWRCFSCIILFVHFTRLKGCCGESEYSADIIGGVTTSILYILLDANVILTGQGEGDIQRLCGGESKLEKCLDSIAVSVFVVILVEFDKY